MQDGKKSSIDGRFEKGVVAGSLGYIYTIFGLEASPAALPGQAVQQSLLGPDGRAQAWSLLVRTTASSLQASANKCVMEWKALGLLQPSHLVAVEKSRDE